MFPVIVIALAAAASCAASEEHDHHWEYAGVFQVSNRRMGHTIIIEKQPGIDYSEFVLDILVVPCASGDHNGLEEAEELAEMLVETQSPIELTTAHADIYQETLYEVSLPNLTSVALLSLRFQEEGYYAVFLGHEMDELCSTHCFRDSDGEHLEALLEETAHGNEHLDEEGVKDWGSSVGGAFVVWAAVFSGILLLGGGIKRYEALSENVVHHISMFAAGALLSTAFCLILLEASHFISASDLSEAQVSALWGSMILTGFLTATIIDMIREAVLYLVKGRQVAADSTAGDETEENNSTEMVAADKELNLEGAIVKEAADAIPISDSIHTSSKEGIVVSILAGDFLHNFCDGVFIGAAFQSCSNTLGWTIVATTACHEIAQEIADFIILTKVAGLQIPQALAVNAASGLSVVLGSIVVSATDLSDLSIGVLLAFGSGNYIYLAASELFPSVHSDSHSGKGDQQQSSSFNVVLKKVFGLLMFGVGACAVGLVLLNHEHCEVSSDSAAHDH